jgi:hypothetical protein
MPLSRPATRVPISDKTEPRGLAIVSYCHSQIPTLRRPVVPTTALRWPSANFRFSASGGSADGRIGQILAQGQPQSAQGCESSELGEQFVTVQLMVRDVLRLRETRSAASLATLPVASTADAN